MPYAVTGSPVGPFVDALLAVMLADDALVALLGGAALAPARIVTALPTHTRTDRPYIVVPRHELAEGSVAMQKAGGKVSVVIDVYSAEHDPTEAQQIQSRIRALFPRDRTLSVLGFTVYGGSLDFEEERTFPDDDPDMPERSGFHGMQRLVADLEEAG